MTFALTAEQLLVAASLRAAVILMLAYSLSHLLSTIGASAAARHKLWIFSLAASLAAPLLLAVLPAWRISTPWPKTAWLPTAFADPAAPTEMATDMIAWSVPMEQSPNHAPLQNSPVATRSKSSIASQPVLPELSKPNPPTRSRIAWAFWFWSMGTIATLLPTALGLISLGRLSRSSHTVIDGPLLATLRQLTHQLGITRRVRLITSEDRSMPMTWGIRRPTILLPAAAESWTNERLKIVFLHELAHIARRDCLAQLVGQFARASYWFNPLAWLAERQLRIEQERACDDFVLSRGFDPPDYADHLLAVSTNYSPGLASALALAMSHSSNLEHRLMAILNPSLNRRPLSHTVTRIMATLTIAATVFISLTHVESTVTAGDAPGQKDAKNDEPAAVVADRSQALAVVRAKIADQYVTPINESDILEGALKGMIGALKDPYSDYLTPQSLSDLERQLGSSIVGIGVQLELLDKQVRVVTPLAGSPALRGGIQSGDAILEIDGQSTAGLGLTDVVKRIAGPAATNVRLKIGRDNSPTLDLNIARGTVSLPTVSGFRRAADDSWNLLIDNAHKIGYLQFSQFSTATPREAREAIDSLQRKGVKGLILDLRYCPGGALDSAVSVAKLFLSSGTVVTLHPRTGEPTTLKSDSPAALGDVPLLVLVNGQTASAAEILAGALQDNQRAVVLGTRTTGKASVQTLIKLDGDSGAIKLTTAEYRLPSGRNIDKRGGEKTWGINPDDGYFVPISAAQSKTMLDRRRERDIIRPAAEKTTKASSTITPASIEQDESDPQLAAALKSMTARLQSGAFTKVSTLTPSQINQILKRGEIEQRRETARQALEKIDRELADLN